ncbi:DUF4124 domain-containing protein [Legionella waltersii]|uniref:DUF4124 domain-containing protein n=1 Tax=Legionella waltersii TaxID=66969 RepID=A0A0W1AM16_9GAMM|nr:DUF4124 domain-containing protein [Legionella waltersii]KTD82334.1 hypothetical protein Lwal_0811 [Legionella waltersii]SNV03983.1 Uncharacterised protein [Legionella waltersii]
MKKLALFICLMICINLTYSQIYKWIDSQGIVHFTDKPHEGAEKIKLPETQTYTPPKTPEEGTTENQKKEEQPTDEEKYTTLSIIQPENEATIRNNQGYIVVAVEVNPELSAGDMVQVIFDGAPMGDPQSNLVFQLNGVYRGSHSIGVQIVTPSGAVIKTSKTIQIFMHRPRVGMGKKK